VTSFGKNKSRSFPFAKLKGNQSKKEEKRQERRELQTKTSRKETKNGEVKNWSAIWGEWKEKPNFIRSLKAAKKKEPKDARLIKSNCLEVAIMKEPHHAA